VPHLPRRRQRPETEQHAIANATGVMDGHEDPPRLDSPSVSARPRGADARAFGADGDAVRDLAKAPTPRQYGKRRVREHQTTRMRGPTISWRHPVDATNWWFQNSSCDSGSGPYYDSTST